MHRTLKLHHHRHTGKLLHHRHTSYWALLLLAVFAGIVGFLTVEVAQADNLAVTATVPAPIPAGAPTFTNPTDGTVVDKPLVTFDGTCPVITPSIIVVLYEGSQALGSTRCQGDGTFSVQIQLSPGPHAIVATVVTITNGTGESSAPLHITYTPPTPPAPSPTNPIPTHTPTSAGATAPLNIISDTPFLSFGIHSPAQWQGHFTGGTPPYKLTIVWGDDTVTVEKNLSEAPQTYLHYYTDQHLYSVSLTLTDQHNISVTRYLVAVSLSPATSTASLAAPIDLLPLPSLVGLYLGLLLLILLLWRYELLHHRQVVGIPLHYGWQSSGGQRAKTRRTQRH